EFLNINNLSSLTYSPHDGYLYATVNKPAKLLIISTGGAMRQIKNMPFIKDAESIEHLTENMFLAADEETSILYQAEGVVIAPNGDIYIESEPNIFYHFKKQVDDKNNDNQQS
ncbi:TPA: hypothetical protein IBI90_004816, partial [Escherichia coli]|nr:hypothetical protein [Escherichia coli]